MYQNSKNNSPFQNQSSFNDSPEQQLHESLDKYLNVPLNDNYTDKLKKEIVLAQIESINSDLSSISKERFGDLTTGTDKTDSQWQQIDKTIKLVKSLISCIYRDAQTKKELNIKLRRGQEQISRQAVINQKLSRDKRTLQKEKQSLELKIKSLQRQFKEDMQKIKRDKEEAEKKFQQISNKQNQFKTEMRKNQQMISELQEKIKNKTIDKNLVKNKFEIIEEIKNYGPSLILSNSQNQFNKFFVNNFEANHRAIVQENEYLKNCLQSVYKELHELLQVRKDVIRKRKGFEAALQSDAFQLDTLKPETFNLPKEFSHDSMEKLNDNLQKFKEAIKLNNLVNDKVQDQKIQCINNVKNLLANYKQIVEGQDKLINRVVLRSKQFKANEMANIQNKYSRLEDDELERSKRFLEEQRQILLNRNRELEMTRKAMKNTIKRAEEQKKLFNKRKTETNQQLIVLRKNIEKLPAMIEEQIGSVM